MASLATPYRSARRVGCRDTHPHHQPRLEFSTARTSVFEAWPPFVGGLWRGEVVTSSFAASDDNSRCADLPCISRSMRLVQEKNTCHCTLALAPAGRLS